MEMLRVTSDAIPYNVGEGILDANGEMCERMAAMALMLRETNERLAAMEQALRTLEKVTPYQAKNVNRLVRDRAAEVCREYRMPGQEKKVAGAIRRTVRELTGVKTAQEIARCDYQTVLEAVGTWDRYDVIQGIRKAARG